MIVKIAAACKRVSAVRKLACDDLKLFCKRKLTARAEEKSCIFDEIGRTQSIEQGGCEVGRRRVGRRSALVMRAGGKIVDEIVDKLTRLADEAVDAREQRR